MNFYVLNYKQGKVIQTALCDVFESMPLSVRIFIASESWKPTL